MTGQNHLEFPHRLSPGSRHNISLTIYETYNEYPRQGTNEGKCYHTAKRNDDLFSISPIMLLLASDVLEVDEITDDVSFFASRFINV